MAKDERADDGLELSRFTVLLGLLFAWRPLPDLSDALDKRRRTTDVHRRFRKHARGLLIATALLLARAYISLIVDATQSTPDWPYFQWLFPATSVASLGWSWLQAQLAAQGVFSLYYKIARVTFADHGIA